MERRICTNCGTPQQWELWQQCACGHEFGPPEPKPSMPSEPGATPSWLDGLSPEEAIRSVRTRMACSWGLILLGLTTLYWLDGKPSFSLLLTILGVRHLRRKIPDPAAPKRRSAPIAYLSAVMIAAAAIIFLPKQILPFIFIPPLTLLVLYVVIAEVKQFRSPLRFFSPEELARLKND